MRRRLSRCFSRRSLRLATVILALLLAAGLGVHVWDLLPGSQVIQGGEMVFGLRPLLTIAGPGRGQYREFLRPTGAAFGPDGEIFVADAGNHRVVALTSGGRLHREFGGFGATRPLAGSEPVWSAGLFNNPADIDVDEDGTIYVADPRNNHVQVFDRDGTFLRRLPRDGEEVPQEVVTGRATVTPMDVAVAGGLVYVADVGRVLVFTTEGDYVRQLGRASSDSVHFDEVTGVAATRDGRMFVVDAGNGRIVAVGTEGEKLWSVGGSPEDSQMLAESHTYTYRFGLPRSVTLMDDGNVAVLDSLDSTVALFTEDGEFVARYGVRGARPAEFSDPEGIDSIGNLLLVADTGNHRVQIVEVAR